MKLEQIKANCFGEEAATRRHTDSHVADYDRQDFAALLALVPTRLALKKNETRHDVHDTKRPWIHVRVRCVLLGKVQEDAEGNVCTGGEGQLCPVISLTPF